MSGASNYSPARARANAARAKKREEERRRKIEEERRKREEMIQSWKREEERYLHEGRKRKNNLYEVELNKKRRELVASIKEEKIKVSGRIEKGIDKNELKQQVLLEVYDALTELNTYSQKLYNQKLSELEKIKNASKQKIEFFYSSLKLDLGKAKSDYVWTRTYKKSIEDVLNRLNNNISSIDEDLSKKIEKFLTLDFIDEHRYDELFMLIQTTIEEQIFREEMASILTKALETLDYVVVDNLTDVAAKLINREKVILSTDSNEYKIVIVLNKENTILTRFVRIVEDEKEIRNATTSQKIVDKEHVKKWCASQTLLQEQLESLGLDLDLNIVEDENSDILYMIDRDKENNRNKQKINIGVANHG